tara:strand:- start:3782 stop:4501 length:720 start_codon:yes stop_codon:yes gene_type:complete
MSSNLDSAPFNNDEHYDAPANNDVYDEIAEQRRNLAVEHQANNHQQLNNSTNITNLTKKELQDMCSRLGLPKDGNKDVLQARINGHQANNNQQNHQDNVEDDDVEDDDDDVEDDDDADDRHTTTTTMTQKNIKEFFKNVLTGAKFEWTSIFSITLKSFFKFFKTKIFPIVMTLFFANCVSVLLNQAHVHYCSPRMSIDGFIMNLFHSPTFSPPCKMLLFFAAQFHPVSFLAHTFLSTVM